MSFIKIKDPRKREELIKDFIETRKRIKDNFIAQKVGEVEYQTGLTKLFKPVTETQKATAKEITEAQKATAKEITEAQKETAKEITEAQKETAERIEKGLLPIKEGIEDLKIFSLKPGDIMPAIEYPEEKKAELGYLAVDSLTKTHGRTITQSDINPIDPKESLYKISKTKIWIENNDIYIDGVDGRTKGTPGLWKLITSRDIPDKTEYEPEDLKRYIKIMYFTNATYDKNNKRVAGNNKMNKLIKPLVIAAEKGGEEGLKIEINKYLGHEAFKVTSGTGPKPGTSGTGLILPSDPNALIDRFDLLFSSKKAGHTGVRNEIISILDELKRQKVINVNEYKKLNSLIKK